MSKDQTDWRAELERWLAWHEENAEPPRERDIHQTWLPPWHDRDADPDLDQFGWGSDHEWAVTRWPNPRYL